MRYKQSTISPDDRITHETIKDAGEGSPLHDFIMAHAIGGEILGVTVEFTDGSSLIYTEVPDDEPQVESSTRHPSNRHLRLV